MIELLAILLLLGGLAYRLHVGLVALCGISALTSAFFFITFLTRAALLRGVLLGATLCLGGLVVKFHETKTAQEFFAVRDISGVVQSVDRRLDKTVLVVKDSKYKKSVQATVRGQAAALPGDTVDVQGTVSRPEDFVTDTGRLFGYDGYLQSKGIAGIVSPATVIPIAAGNPSLVRIATKLRFSIAALYSKHIAFPVDGIVSGMLVGYKGSIPEEIETLFKTTGVLHVLVLSGENITLLAIFLSIILKPLPFHIRSALTGFGIVLIVLVSGAGVAAVRSGIMGIISIGGGMAKRGYVPLRALTISIALFFFYSPETVYVDPGFHLSVLATFFMVAMVSKVEPLFNFLPEKYGIRSLVVLAIAMPLFMLPHTMYFSGLQPVAAPFANIVMNWGVPALMLLGAAVLAVSWIAPAAKIMGVAASFIGNCIVGILKVLDKLPQLHAPPLSGRGVLAIYSLLLGIVFRKELMSFWREQRTAFLQRSNSSGPESR
ncbi:MAG: ComEC/Rec2 family competence protein [Patescibacteria group bacterium]